jgi:DNA mismatch repair protein MSH6
MGGKSTYLRQAAVATLLAQVGCFVPAESCSLTPADRIFTRVGASDRILAGQSTFFVELAETSAIVNNATADSLVILDELGRGTSTFDGNAIAWAVTRHLTAGCGSRALFATHYHTLTEEFAADPRVTLGHMACMVQRPGAAPTMSSASSSSSPSSSSSASSRADEQVTFLYRFARGGCPKSYGLNVARLAQLPEEVIARAGERSAEFEEALATAIGKSQGAEAAEAARGVGREEVSVVQVAEQANRLLSDAHGTAAGVADEALLALVHQAQAMAL